MHERALEALRARLESARTNRRPPYRCPITSPVAPEMARHTIPRQFRTLAGTIYRERRFVNRPAVFGPSYYHMSSIVADYYSWLIGELRSKFRLSDTTIIELNMRWTFSTITHEELQRIYDTQPKPKHAAEGAPSGPSDHMYRDRPSEKCHLFEYYASRQLESSSLEQYLDMCRDENKKRRG